MVYDGECRLCLASVDRLRRWVGPGVRFLPLQGLPEEGVAGLDPAAARARVHAVAPDGRVFAGAEAIARLLQTSRWRWMASAYFVPPVRRLADAAYAWVARNRYVFGRHARCEGPCRLEDKR